MPQAIDAAFGSPTTRRLLAILLIRCRHERCHIKRGFYRHPGTARDGSHSYTPSFRWPLGGLKQAPPGFL